MSNIYDVIILGAGPSGLSTATYTSRAGLNTLIIEQGLYGGQMNNTADIENYTGFEKISGSDLSEKMYQSSLQFGAEYTNEFVEKIEDQGDVKNVITNKNNYQTKTVVISTGFEYQKINKPGEDLYQGRGVSYCAVCDGNFFKNKHVAVVGGGNAAIEESTYLANIVSKVTIIHRRDQLRADKVYAERAFNNPKIEFLFEKEVVSINGDDQKLNSLTLVDAKSGEESQLKIDGVFIYIGMLPNTSSFKNLDILDENGWIITDQNMKTTIPGIYAVGDVRQNSIGQITTAVGEGSIAGKQIFDDLQISVDKELMEKNK